MTENELIAEFMGWKQMGNPPTDNWNDGKDIVRARLFNAYMSSWEWLMPVVEKISKITFKWESKHESGTDSHYPRTFGMINDETNQVMVRFNNCPLHAGDTLIEATYKAVVEFIKWYNFHESKKQ